MTKYLILSGAYIIGYIISFCMLRVEVAAEKQVYNKGDRILGITFSLLSWLAVLVILVATWIKHIGKTGYWNEPVIKEPVKAEPE